MWVTVMNPKRISMRIWERGVGETLGCGTGAAAAVVAAKLHHWTEDEVEVVSKGGVVRVNWRPDERIRLTGDAQYVFEGSFLNDD
jgi:diaminopimelate epimerase